MSIFIPFLNGDLKPEKRSGHVSVYYQGLLLVFGGYGEFDQFLSSRNIWCYNVEATQWTRYTTKGDIPGNATGSCVTLVGDNMYLFGGYYQNEGQTNYLYSLDLKTFTWYDLTESTKGRRPSPRDKFGCWTIGNQIVYFGGFGFPPDNLHKVKGDFCFEEFPQGYSRGFGWNNHLFSLECSENLKWKQPTCIGRRPRPRAAFAATQIGTKGYLFGGRFKDERRDDLFCLDLETFEWQELITLTNAIPPGRSWHVMAKASDQHLFVYGGFSTDGDALKDTWLYNTENNEWTELENASNHLGCFAPRLWHTACATDTPGEILIFGGCSNSVLGSESTIHANNVAVFRFSPVSLRRLCIDYIVSNVSLYHEYVKSLPKSLQRNIYQRCHALGLDATIGHGQLVSKCSLL
ncbi:kelch domain-containing protein 2-like isoform X1 [Hydractinia symbiolongicarpus]|uniref:kelch domain-containing protein 2-like isoform X1 n=1 Tax=Hydractinia symbiolongicarpus TaxID=13093 RepID=UPI00254FA938|nr:kelch domain-containing protein 2-like isoform X1 [Hydractinia symbiolongicarpus]